MVTAGHCFSGADPSVNAIGYYSDNIGHSYGVLQRDDWAQRKSFTDAALVTMPASNGWAPRAQVVVLGRQDVAPAGQNTGPATAENLNYPILGRMAAMPGNRACFTGGQTRNTDCGTIGTYFFGDAAYNYHVDYCGSDHGDSGGPIYSANNTVGLLRGGFSACDNFFTDMADVESSLGVTFTTGG